MKGWLNDVETLSLQIFEDQRSSANWTMMSDAVHVVPYAATIEDGPAYWQVGILWVILATAEQTAGKYSLIWELCPQGSGPPPHYHDQDEQFYLIDGEITFRAGDKELRVTSGSFVFIPRGTVHYFRVDSETATILNSYTPGGFERSIMELGEPAPARTLPPADHEPSNPGTEKITSLFHEIGMHVVDQPDLLRSTPSTYP